MLKISSKIKIVSSENVKKIKHHRQKSENLWLNKNIHLKEKAYDLSALHIVVEFFLKDSVIEACLLHTTSRK